MANVGHNSSGVNAEHLRALIERVNGVLSYNRETGALTWLVSISNRAPTGARAGNLSHGYREISIDGISYRATHLIWLICFGRFPSAFVDHRNGVPSDDSLDNLREATPAQNARNVKTHADNKIGFKGVQIHRGRSKPYQARIYVGGRQKSLGYFKTPQQAHDAYARAAVIYFGEFARAS